MAGYLKKIAVIKQVKSGFSADGGQISGLVKAETYAGFLKAEVSLLNFAPLSEGRYVFGISDGVNFAVFEDVSFECETAFDMRNGFAFLVCFCHGEAAPVASAYCGNAASALPALKEEIARREKVKPKKQTGGAAYDDEAIAEINYYEHQTDKDCQPVREDKAEEQLQDACGKDEKAVRPVKIQTGGIDDCGILSENMPQAAFSASEADGDGEEPSSGGLAGGDFYSRMQGDIERIFASFPPEKDLEAAVEGSRFVRIGYGQNRYYVFGILTVEGKPAYICYGVPSSDPSKPPKSLSGCSSYIPCKNGGYWMTYQDARTGVSVDIASY